MIAWPAVAAVLGALVLVAAATAALLTRRALSDAAAGRLRA
jgi:hypothetical protein